MTVVGHKRFLGFIRAMIYLLAPVVCPGRQTTRQKSGKTPIFRGRTEKNFSRLSGLRFARNPAGATRNVLFLASSVPVFSVGCGSGFGGSSYEISFLLVRGFDSFLFVWDPMRRFCAQKRKHPRETPSGPASVPPLSPCAGRDGGCSRPDPFVLAHGRHQPKGPPPDEIAPFAGAQHLLAGVMKGPSIKARETEYLVLLNRLRPAGPGAGCTGRAHRRDPRFPIATTPRPLLQILGYRGPARFADQKSTYV